MFELTDAAYYTKYKKGESKCLCTLKMEVASPFKVVKVLFAKSDLPTLVRAYFLSS